MSWLRILGLGGKGGRGSGGGDPLSRLAPWRAAHRRTAWRPRTEERDGPIGASKFCGVPWLAAGEPWPVCSACRRPMPLFLQFDLASASHATGAPLGTGLLQLFYCAGEDCQAEGWAPFDGGKLVRVVPGDASGVAQVPPSGLPAWNAKRIVGWDPEEDYPHPEEHDELGLACRYEFRPYRAHVTWAEGGVSFETTDEDFAERLANASVGDKLLGWPHWIQSVEYPGCPRCGKRMELLFQVDSEDQVPFMFGDVGCGHVTRCPDHPDVVTFGWACS